MSNRKALAEKFENDVYTITITGRNVLITDAMKQYAIDKISKIEKFHDRIIDVAVRMDIQKLEHRVEIVMKVGHIVIKAQSSVDDMYAAIDLATDKLQRQLLKWKDKIQDHTAKKLSVVDLNVNVLRATDPVDEINDEIEAENKRRLFEEYGPHDIVSTEKHPLKMLTQEEAIMKMDLSGNHFLIYRCEEDQKIKVIYRRTDGNYGVIEVEQYA